MAKQAIVESQTDSLITKNFWIRPIYLGSKFSVIFKGGVADDDVTILQQKTKNELQQSKSEVDQIAF